MPTKPRQSQWTPGDSDRSEQLTGPLLLVLDREERKSLDKLSKEAGASREPIYRALRYMCSRGLAHRREERLAPSIRPISSEEAGVKRERVIQRWILSERGEAYRDRLIDEGKLRRRQADSPPPAHDAATVEKEIQRENAIKAFNLALELLSNG